MTEKKLTERPSDDSIVCDYTDHVLSGKTKQTGNKQTNTAEQQVVIGEALMCWNCPSLVLSILLLWLQLVYFFLFINRYLWCALLEGVFDWHSTVADKFPSFMIPKFINSMGAVIITCFVHGYIAST